MDAFGIPMDHPDASLIAETTCRTAPPAQCAFRDLGDGRVAAKDYIGVSLSIDHGGVHHNSTIFSGALWEIREQLGGTKADKVVYKALTEYMTPLDDFADGRVLVDGLTDPDAIPDVAGDRYVVPNSSPDGAAPPAILTGRLSGGRTVTLSEGERWNYAPATDGRQAVWASFDAEGSGFQIHARPLDAGTPPRLVAETPEPVNTVAASGEAVAWDVLDPATGENDVWLKRGTATPVNLTAAAHVQGFRPTMKGTRLAYLRVWKEGGVLHSTPAVYDVATGTEVIVPEPPGTGGSPSDSAMPIMTSAHVVWIYDADRDGRYGIMRAAADGTGSAPVVPDGPDAQDPDWFDANDTTATIGAWPPRQDLANAKLPKLFQVPVTGGTLRRYSCDRGEQSAFAAGDGGTVVWLDSTAGDTDLVIRDRPVPGC